MACWAAVMMVSGCELGLGVGRLGHLAEHFLWWKEKFVRGDFECRCDFFNVGKGDVPAFALDSGDVGAVESALARQFFLRPAVIDAIEAHVVGDNGTEVLWIGQAWRGSEFVDHGILSLWFER